MPAWWGVPIMFEETLAVFGKKQSLIHMSLLLAVVLRCDMMCVGVCRGLMHTFIL